MSAAGRLRGAGAEAPTRALRLDSEATLSDRHFSAAPLKAGAASLWLVAAALRGVGTIRKGHNVLH